MKGLELYCDKAVGRGIDEAKVIDPHSIATAEWVRMKCQFGCRIREEPLHPLTDARRHRKVIDAYEKVILLHRPLKKGKEERLQQAILH
jgi:predicted metal-binding protein